MIAPAPAASRPMSRRRAPAAISSAAIARQVTSAVPRSPTPTTRHAEPDDPEHRHHPPDPALDHLRPGREQLGAEQDQRDLHQLRGLDLERPGAEPGARAVDLDPDPGQQHGEAEEERAGEQQRRQRPQHPDARAGEHVHDHQADGAEDQRALEVVGAVAGLAEQRRGRAGAEDHDHAEGEQAEGRGQQQRVLDRLVLCGRARCLRAHQSLFAPEARNHACVVRGRAGLIRPRCRRTGRRPGCR